MSQTVLIWQTGAMYLFTVSLQHEANNDVTDHYVERGANITDHVRPQPDTFSLACFITNEPLEPVLSGQTDNGNTVIPSGGTPQESLDLVPVINAFGTNQSADAFGFAGTFNIPTILTVKDWFNPLFGIPIVSAFTAGEVPGIISPDVHPITKKTITQAGATVLQFGNEWNANRLILEQLRQLRDDAEIITVYTTEHVYDNMVIENFQMPRSGDTGTGSELTINFKAVRIVISQLVDAPTPVADYPRGYDAQSNGTQNPEEVTGSKRSSWARQILRIYGGGLFK